MNKVDFDCMSGMLVDVERLLLRLLEGKADEAKHHLETVLNNSDCHERGDFITACAICNNIEMDKRNAEKAIYTLFRMISKYKRNAK
jgi:hypothetical protein